MADNALAQSPLLRAMNEARARRAAAVASVVAPREPAAASNPFETAAAKYGIPVNSLAAIGEVAGIEDADGLGAGLSKLLAEGRSMPDAIAALAPGASIDAMRQRAIQIGESYGVAAPPPPATPAPRERGIVETIVDPFGTTGELVKGVGRGIAGAVSAGAKTLGYDETAARAGEIAENPAIAPDVQSFRDVDGLGSGAKYVAGLLGESVPEMAAVTGAAIGGTAAAGPAGGIGAAVATSAFFNTGRNIARQEQELPDEEPSLSRALGVGLAQGGLDAIAPGRIASGFLGRLLGAVGERGGVQLAKEVGEDVLIEGATETGQQLMEMGQANPDLLRILVNPQTPDEVERSDHLVDELAESFIGGAAAGGAVSAGGRVLGSAMNRPAPEPAPEPPLGLPAPALITPPPAGGVEPPVDTPPAGALERALTEGPAPLAPEMMPGAEIEISVTNPETGEVLTLPGVFMGEHPDGILVRNEDGTDALIPREEIEGGLATVRTPGQIDPPRIMDEVSAPAAEPVAPTAGVEEGAPAATIATGLDPAEVARVEGARARAEEPAPAFQPAEPAPGGLGDQALGTVQPQTAPARSDAPASPQTPEAIRERIDYLRAQRRSGTNLKRINAEIRTLEERLADIAPSQPVASAAESEEGATAIAPSVETPAAPAAEVAAISPPEQAAPEGAGEGTAPAPSTNEPPVPAGFVRMYHGTPGADGEPADAGGSRWFSTARAYARDYRGGGDEGLWYVDVPRSDRMFDDGETGYGIEQGRTFNVDFDPADYGGAKRVVPIGAGAPVAQVVDYPRHRLAESGAISEAAGAAGAEAPASHPTIENIREKAAIVRGIPQDTPPEVPGVSLKWDEKAGGFVFSRKYAEKVRAALGAQEQPSEKAADRTEEPAAAAPQEQAPTADAASTPPEATAEGSAPPSAPMTAEGSVGLGLAEAAGREAKEAERRRSDEAEKRGDAAAIDDATRSDLWSADRVRTVLAAGGGVADVGQLSPSARRFLKDGARDGSLTTEHSGYPDGRPRYFRASPPPATDRRPERRPSPPQIPPIEGMAPMGKALDYAAEADAKRAAWHAVQDVVKPHGGAVHPERIRAAVAAGTPASEIAAATALKLAYKDVSPSEALTALHAIDADSPDTKTIEGMLRVGKIGNTQQGEDFQIAGAANGTADAVWATVHAIRKGWLKRKGDFLVPTKEFKAWREAPEPTPSAEETATDQRAPGAERSPRLTPGGSTPPAGATYGASNKLVTADRAAEARKKPLYVARDVQARGAGALRAWARSQGFSSIVADPHVTIAFSRDKVDPTAAPAADDFLDFDLDGARLKKLGTAVVLPINDDGRLEAGWQRYRDAGASWDFDGYQPHVTITYEPGDVDLSKVEPFTGRISLGPEVHDDLDPDAVSKVKEVPTETPAKREARERAEARAANKRMREEAKREKEEQALRDAVVSVDELKGGTIRAIDQYAPLEVSAPNFTGSRQLVFRRGTLPRLDTAAGAKPTIRDDGKAAEIVAAAGKDHQPIEWLFVVRQKDARPGAPEKWRLATVVGKVGDTWVGIEPRYLDFIRRNKLDVRYAGNEAVLGIVNADGETVGAVAAKRTPEPERAEQMLAVAREKGFVPGGPEDTPPSGNAAPASDPATEDSPAGATEAEPASTQPRDDDGRFSKIEEVDEVAEADVAADGSVATPRARFASAGALRHHLASGPLGEPIGRLIDAGRIVLHEAEASLPRQESDGASALRASQAVLAWRQSLRQLLANKLAPNADIPVGGVPKVLRALGIPGGRMVMRASKAELVIKDHADIGNQVMLNIPSLIADPLAVFEQEGKTGDFFVVTRARSTKGKPVAVSILSEGTDRSDRPATVVVTIYPLDSPAETIGALLHKDRLLYERERGDAAGFSLPGLIPLSGRQSDRPAARPGEKILRYADVFKRPPPGARPSREATIQGLTTADGTIHLVARNLNSRTAVPVLLHEMFHAGGEALIGSMAWRSTVSRLDTILRNQEERRARGEEPGANDAFWDAAIDRVYRAGTRSRDRAEELGAYAIEEYEKAPGGLREAVDRIIGRVKAFVLRRFGAQLGEATPAQLRALAAGALREAGRWRRHDAAWSRSAEEEREASAFAADFLSQLAAVDDFFAFPKSAAATLKGVFADIDPSVKVLGDMHVPPEDANGADQKILLRTGGEKPKDLFVFQTDEKVWIDVSALPEGGAGSAVYAAVGDYARNTGRVFVGDPAGLSDVALRRRTENMLSSAFRWGSTNHIEPHERQVKGDEALGIPPLRWRDGDTLGNMTALIEVSQASLLHHIPELARARYDFASRTFRTSSGKPLSDETLDRWRVRYPRIGAAGAGRRTLKRGVLLNSLLRATRGERPRLLALALRQPHQLVESGGPRGVLYSVAADADAAPSEAQVASAEPGMISNALTQAMHGDYGLLGLVPGRPLFAELAAKMPAAQEYLRMKGEMDALRNEWHARADDLAQKWRKLIARDGEANTSLMDIMHEATLAGADPSKPFKFDPKGKDEGTRKRRWNELKERFDALPGEFQEMFGEVRDTYKALSDEFEKALLDNIQKSMDVGIARAERAHAAAMQEARDEGLTGEALAKAKAAADKKLATAKTWGGWNKRSKMAELRQMFETGKVPEPYFPLARFGPFFVTVRDKESGAVVAFSRFEHNGVTPMIAAKRRAGLHAPQTQAEFAAEMRAEGYDVEEGTIGEDGLREMVDPAFMADIEGVLQEAGVPEAVMDSIWQRWLETLPDLSIRKSRIHRKGTPGFSGDAFRAFGQALFHGSHQLARLRYAMDLQEALELTKAAARLQPDPVRAGLIAEEMERRHEFTMNPKGAWWSQAITSAAFVWHLAVSPAAALVNLTQTTVIGIPVLAAFWGDPAKGAARASRELGRALKDFGDGRGWAERSKRLTEDERGALLEAYRRGTLDASQAHDLAGVSDSGIEYSDLRTKWMSRISFFFHHAERLNREITFLAAYRMARAKGAGHFKSIDKASDLTWKTHFDYQNTSRARFMQGDVARSMLVFRNYQANMIWRLFRDSHQALHGASAEERREALTQLGGITASMALHAGITGTWMYGLAMMLAGLFFDDGSDEAEELLKKGTIDLLGPQLAKLVLDGVPGALTGTSLSERIGMPDLWFRSPDRPIGGEDLYLYWVEQMLGAGWGLLAKPFIATDKASDGHYMRAIEDVLPKAAKDILRAYRTGAEGVTTLKGDPITDPSMAQAWVQLMGFTPARVAERYEANTRMRNKQERIEGDRRRLINRTVADIKESGAPSPETLARIMELNQAVPTYPITGDTIRRSMQGRARAAARSEFGLQINPRLNEKIRSEAAPTLY